MDRLIPILGRAAIAGLIIAAGTGLAQKEAANGSTTNIPGALPNVHLVAPVANGQWIMPAGDFGNLRYSPLGQINTSNVHNLHVVANMADGIPHGHEGGPLVVGNMLYMVTPFPNNLIAYDLSQPNFPLKWKYEPHPDVASQGIACCDVVNRGASYADGKIIYALLDAHVVAVDAQTGHEVWRTQVGDIHYGETTTMAPIVVKDKVYVGNSGGELGVRGKLTALDVKTGKIDWTAWSTGPDEDVRIGPDFKPFYAHDQQGKDQGIKSWTPGQWKIGGGTIWGWVSYDPELNLIYYGTGNPGPWNPDMRPGDNKWTVTIFARDADTGMAKWAWQLGPHDEWDYDEIMENILVDMPWKGQMRKLLIHPGRSGFVFVMDRTTGELLSASQYEPTNWATGYDLKTGQPIEVKAKETHFGKYSTDICPSSTGAKDFIPSSFSPRTGLVYIPAHNTCMDYMGTAVNYIAGTPYLGASVRMYPGPGGYQGELVAWDVAQGKKVWSVKEPDLPVYSGVLSTGGDLVFYGTMDGWFRALDAHSGKVLWQFKTPSGIVGNPMTFTGPDGKQYVAIYSGVGGWMGATALPEVSTDDPYAALGVVGAMKKIKTLSPPGDLLYVFGL
ncbi:PQQ-dependent dehydrogenase, methanol/ethanol family [Occallatibacter riparius]|uniref:PQQ-dependent dehydrogenase, methanol/ethanol family n=1 Tax=Occallatibacter riparius TaxID=1002689 RepID=A0A9J7BVG6_9BACT|nr:PQQ-dependent dehydrogenase, methanol/ethanol family [Occallatibacter riparius]UWZ86679.1 PQQ-dependent dehydrogenase, methanol/ethanol family [Occallatibacter riparius]